MVYVVHTEWCPHKVHDSWKKTTYEVKGDHTCRGRGWTHGGRILHFGISTNYHGSKPARIVPREHAWRGGRRATRRFHHIIRATFNFISLLAKSPAQQPALARTSSAFGCCDGSACVTVLTKEEPREPVLGDSATSNHKSKEHSTELHGSFASWEDAAEINHITFACRFSH